MVNVFVGGQQTQETDVQGANGRTAQIYNYNYNQLLGSISGIKQSKREQKELEQITKQGENVQIYNYKVNWG